MQAFLALYGIRCEPRPIRRHNNSAIVERKRHTLKGILKGLQAEESDESDATVLNRATFLSNDFAGSKLLSSFKPARGYSPSLLEIPTTVVGNELFQDSCK